MLSIVKLLLIIRLLGLEKHQLNRLKEGRAQRTKAGIREEELR